MTYRQRGLGKSRPSPRGLMGSGDGLGLDLPALAAGGIVTFAMTQLAISATQIRKLLANGKSARYLLPDAVLDYIQLHQLYRNA